MVTARLGAMVCAVALVATGCGGTGEPADEQDALIDAIEATRAGSFTFEVTGELSPAFRDAIVRNDPEAAPALTMLSSASLTGHSDGEDVAATFEMLGADLAEARTIADSDLYLRVDTATIADISQGGFDLDHAVASIAELAMPPEISAFLEAGVRGGWVGVLGIDDLDLADIGTDGLGFPVESLGGDVDRIDETIQRTRERFSDPAVVVGEFTTVTVTDSDEGQVYQVAIELHALIREAAEIVGDFVGDPVPEEDVQQTLDDAPERIDGLVITTRESRITGVSFDVGRAAAAFPDAPPELQPGAVVIEIALADHGAAEAVDAPDDAVTITAEQLVEVFLSLFAGMIGPM